MYTKLQRMDGEATGGVYSYGQRQGSVENDGASVHGPRPSEMRRGLGKARQVKGLQSSGRFRLLEYSYLINALNDNIHKR